MPDEQGSELLPDTANGRKTWGVIDCRPAGSNALIIYPYSDHKRHFGNGCWCEPKMELGQNGAWLHIHKAIDGRSNYQGTKINA